MNSDHVAKLPIDLVLEICRYLPLRSIACLALSKKSLYHARDMQRLWRPQLSPSQQIFRGPKDFASHDLGSEWGECQMLHRRKDICNHELLLFLELLEHDLPSHWQCDLCMKLHRRVEHTASGRAYRPCLASQTQGVFYQLPEWKYTIPFGDAQQIIKRHTVGAPHGVPLTTIRNSQGWETVCDWPTQTFVTPEQPPLVWYKRLEVDPEIVDDERGPVLHLWAEQRLFFSGEYIEVLKTRSRDWVRNIGQRAQDHLAICCHQHDIGEHVAEILESQMSLWGASPRFRQCDVCLTAYAFFIRKGHCKDGLQVILSTWTSLGSCRYSFSPAWLISSWLSKGHTWIRDSTIPRPPRPFHNDYSDFYTGEDLTRASIFKRDNIFRPSNMLWRLQPSRSGEPEHELCRTNSLTGTVNSQRSRDRVVADATQRIPVQVEEQVKPSRRKLDLKNWAKQIWRHLRKLNTKRG